MAKSASVVKSQDIKDEIAEIVEEEAFLIKHSGETPEIAYHSGLYYLFEDPEGPRLNPEGVDLMPMKRAVFKRYKKILLRDLKPENRDRKIYRGVARSIANWHRLKNFCYREDFDIEGVRKETAKHLLQFLENEFEEVQAGKRSSCINCSFKELREFAIDLGISEEKLPTGLEKLCMNP